MPTPPPEEMRSIVGWLGEELERFEAQQAMIADASSLLRERRAALISAAVTGQIDVRGLAEAEAA